MPTTAPGSSQPGAAAEGVLSPAHALSVTRAWLHLDSPDRLSVHAHGTHGKLQEAAIRSSLAVLAVPARPSVDGRGASSASRPGRSRASDDAPRHASFPEPAAVQAAQLLYEVHIHACRAVACATRLPPEAGSIVLQAFDAATRCGL